MLICAVGLEYLPLDGGVAGLSGSITSLMGLWTAVKAIK
jgi:hypothetical protein